MTVAAIRYEGSDTEEARRERQRVGCGELPERYAQPWGRPFFAAADPALVPGAVVLDVGSGRRPTLPPEARPQDCNYVGLDVSKGELLAAGEGAYDEIVASDISRHDPELDGRFDLVLSWQVLEHVPSVASALDNMRSYLKPGGRMVAQLSGSRAAFALLGRVIPHSLATRLMRRTLGAEPEEKFPTHYDLCRASDLRALLEGWSEYRILPRFKGGAYFRFWRPLERAYLTYENWAERSGRPNLATHYVISARK